MIVFLKDRGLNPGPTDYKYCAPRPLSHTAVKFENIYKEYLKKIDVLFPVLVFQSFKPVSRGGVRKQVAKTDSQRFSIFFCKFL